MKKRKLELYITGKLMSALMVGSPPSSVRAARCTIRLLW